MWNVDDFLCSCSLFMLSLVGTWWWHSDHTRHTRPSPRSHSLIPRHSAPHSGYWAMAWSPYLVGEEMHSKGATNYNVPQCMQVVQPCSGPAPCTPLPRILYRQPAPLHTNDRDPVTHLCFNDIIPTFKHNNIWLLCKFVTKTDNAWFTIHSTTLFIQSFHH